MNELSEILEPADELVPTSTFDMYSGLWVAVRKGRVIGFDDELDGLLNQPSVRSTDEVFPVPGTREDVLNLVGKR